MSERLDRACAELTAPFAVVDCRPPSTQRAWRLDGREGAGEVQTPVLGGAADCLRVGDRVWLRHAKGGELCERGEGQDFG